MEQVNQSMEMIEGIKQNMQQQIMYSYQRNMSLLKDAVILSALPNPEKAIDRVLEEIVVESKDVKENMLLSIKNGAPSALQLELSMALESSYKESMVMLTETKIRLLQMIEEIKQ